ncbi:MAG: hypothetical protein V8T10_00225 [Merdibacter sp.]
MRVPEYLYHGIMAHYITHADASYFQPMNANFGIVRLEAKVKKHQRKEAICTQALGDRSAWKQL